MLTSKPRSWFGSAAGSSQACSPGSRRPPLTASGWSCPRPCGPCTTPTCRPTWSSAPASGLCSRPSSSSSSRLSPPTSSGSSTSVAAPGRSCCAGTGRLSARQSPCWLPAPTRGRHQRWAWRPRRTRRRRRTRRTRRKGFTPIQYEYHTLRAVASLPPPRTFFQCLPCLIVICPYPFLRVFLLLPTWFAIIGRTFCTVVGKPDSRHWLWLLDNKDNACLKNNPSFLQGTLGGKRCITVVVVLQLGWVRPSKFLKV